MYHIPRNPKSTKTADLAEYFENDYILLIDLDRYCGEKARDLMQAGYPGLKPPDAIHLAAAIIANVEEMHTFDGKLLDLNGTLDKVDGTKLRIVKPDTSAPAPLLDEATKGSVADVASSSPAAKTPESTAPAAAPSESDIVAGFVRESFRVVPPEPAIEEENADSSKEGKARKEDAP